MKLFKKKSDAEILSEVLEETEAAEQVEAEDKKPSKKFKIFNKAKMKYGTYAVTVTAIVIAAAVVLNVLFAVLAKRVNLDIDLSLAGENTLTDDNIEFLESLGMEVTLTVCADKEDYVGGYLDYYTAKQQFSATDSTGEYYSQTIRFLDLYEVYSKNKVKVEYVDPQTPEFSEIMAEHSSANLNYGDIIVSATHTVDGEEIVRSNVVGFDEIYYLEDVSGYASQGYDYYYVSGNSFETAVSGAIKKSVATETYKAAVVSTHCKTSSSEYFASVLGLNNFDLYEINGALIESVPEDVSLLIISAPTEDFAVSELEVIDAWLYNKGERGRSVLFFASDYSPALPNLYSYLEEWGISVGEGVLFDTNSQSHMANDPMTMLFRPTTDTNDTIKAIVGSKQKYLMIASAVPLSPCFETSGYRETYVPYVTYSEQVVAAPDGTSVSWEPTSDYSKSQRSGVIVGCDSQWIDSVEKKSYVIAFASDTVVSTSLASYTSLGNMDAAINAANLVVGETGDEFSFYMKTIDNESYADQVTQSGADAIRIIFQIILPLVLIAGGVVVFVRRQRR